MMNEEEFSSDTEDDDYMPSAEEAVSEDNLSGEEEDVARLQQDAGEGPKSKRTKSKAKKKAEQALASRKRAGGIFLEDEDAEQSKQERAEESERARKLAEEIKKEEEVKKESLEKKKADDLWASFMSDVPKPKPIAATTSTGLGSLSSISKPTKPASSSSSQPSKTAPPPATATSKASIPSSSAAAGNSQAKVTITKEYDFAGEIVRVSKEVAADSKEAKQELEKKEETQTESTVPIGVKRPAASGGGLGSVLGRIGKKPKMSTLEKSKMDWNNFKREANIEDELDSHNKSSKGYLDRKAFLERTDVRQFEIERDMRLGSNSKR